MTPAAFCGVTALRPTYGLVSRHGAMTLSWTLDKLGPFARTAEDCGLILQAISGKDSRDAGSAGKSFYYAPQYARPVKELRIGYAAAEADLQKRDLDPSQLDRAALRGPRRPAHLPSRRSQYHTQRSGVLDRATPHHSSPARLPIQSAGGIV